MISLTLGAEPPILKEKRVEWGEEYRNALLSGVKPRDRYRREDVRDALRDQTYGKCAYCESRIEHISFAHIEHLIPKSKRPDLVCAWDNLTLACEKCNSYKGQYFSDSAPLLNPYVDEVSEAITFFGPMIYHWNDAGKLTISRLRLNRPELLFRRAEHLREVVHILELLAQTQDNEALQMALSEDLADRLLNEAEYASCSRCFTKDEGHKKDAANRIASEMI